MNLWINAWVFAVYVKIQLPLAIVSTAAMGIAAAIFAAIKSVNEMEGFTGFVVQTAITGIETVVGAFGKAFSEVVLGAAQLVFGLGFDPMALFMIGFLVVSSLGAIQILLAWFVYFIAGIHSLSGEAVGAKWAAFLLAVVGICIPILNLFPLILLWTAVVWVKPK
ncbi:MAG: hypothetical protein AAF092_17185 [Pseudomonadota bacterium]